MSDKNQPSFMKCVLYNGFDMGFIVYCVCQIFFYSLSLQFHSSGLEKNVWQKHLSASHRHSSPAVTSSTDIDANLLHLTLTNMRMKMCEHVKCIHTLGILYFGFGLCLVFSAINEALLLKSTHVIIAVTFWVPFGALVISIHSRYMFCSFTELRSSCWSVE